MYFKCFYNDRCIVGIYIFLCYPSFFILFSSMGRWSIQYVWYLCLYDIFWTSTLLLLINALYSFSKNIMKLSYISRKYFIPTHTFTLLHAMKKTETWMGHQVVPMHYPNQFGTYSHRYASSNCDCPLTPGIFNDT